MVLEKRETPKEVWYLMEQTCTVVGVPTNARITEDISRWEWVRDKIIEAKGFIVPDEDFRAGRRARKMHGEGDVRPSFASATARARTCLAGAHEDLLEPVGAGRRRRGLRSVLAELKISGWGGTQEAISSWSSLPK